ncbi:hypothetical protein EDC31_1754 [Acidomonas methanolica]|nr:hypothetical protein EDC31_1754 [Acidomonas methanolica]
MAVAATTKRFLKDYPEALIEGSGAVFVGAGVSMGAGYPSWASLLTEVGEELGVKSGGGHWADLSVRAGNCRAAVPGDPVGCQSGDCFLYRRGNGSLGVRYRAYEECTSAELEDYSLGGQGSSGEH